MSKESESLLPLREVVYVDEQRRIEIDPSFIQSSLGVKLSPGESTSLWAFIGSGRQLQLLAPGSELAKIRDQYEAGAIGGQLPWDAGGDRTADIMRKLGSLLRITCSREPSRRKLRLTIPADAVDLELVEIKSPIVVFVSGQVFELWRPDAWRNACAISSLREFTKQLLDVTGTDK
ncbi:MAG: hypothetical protein WAO02_13565 [Verrucomicrobiia bacterium]